MKKTLELNHIRFVIVLIFLLFFIYSYLLPRVAVTDAHFDRIVSYNSAGWGIGDEYYVFQQTEPEYVKSNEISNIMFSIQDKNGRDVNNVVVTVEIYSAHGERLYVFPWTELEIGDFEIPYEFTNNGNYQVVLSILNEGISSSQILNTVPPSRTILNDSSNCDCERAVFNISVAETFGLIYTFVIYITVFGVVIVLGVVLIWIFLSRRKNKSNQITGKENR